MQICDAWWWLRSREIVICQVEATNLLAKPLVLLKIMWVINESLIMICRNISSKLKPKENKLKNLWNWKKWLRNVFGRYTIWCYHWNKQLTRMMFMTVWPGKWFHLFGVFLSPFSDSTKRLKMPIYKRFPFFLPSKLPSQYSQNSPRAVLRKQP